MPDHLKITSCKLADDCTQYEIIQRDSNSNIRQSLDALNVWAVANKMQLTPKKTKDMWICFRNDIGPPPLLSHGSDIIERVTSFKLLGVWHQNNLKWLRHIEEMTKRANKRLYYLRECRRTKLPAEVGITCYNNNKTIVRTLCSNMGWASGLFAAELENISIIQEQQIF